MKRNIFLFCTFIFLLANPAAHAVEFEGTLGLHDFVVSDIQDDFPGDGIDSGTSHTFGLNASVAVKHTTSSGIHLLAKMEVFLDYDKDELDPDHIPIWFSPVVRADGSIYKINERSTITWHLLMDNRQNTVSCIEREVRQHVGAGYEFVNGGLRLAANVYLGFYYIEIDDDVPVLRGYGRQDLDDGEASHIFELEGHYDFNKNWSVYGNLKCYATNAGGETLEQDYEALLTYRGIEMFGKGSSLNLKVHYVKYDFDRFDKSHVPGTEVPPLPFDNDMLIQTYVSFPINF